MVRELLDCQSKNRRNNMNLDYDYGIVRRVDFCCDRLKQVYLNECVGRRLKRQRLAKDEDEKVLRSLFLPKRIKPS